MWTPMNKKNYAGMDAIRKRSNAVFPILFSVITKSWIEDSRESTKRWEWQNKKEDCEIITVVIIHALQYGPQKIVNLPHDSL